MKVREHLAGWRAYHSGIQYPENKPKEGPFRDGWDAAAAEDEEERFDSADSDFEDMNPYSDY